MDALLYKPPIEILPREQRPAPRTDEITEWCPACLERVVAMSNGSCGWCDTPLGEDAEPGPSVLVPAAVPRRRDRRHRHGKPYTDEQIVARIVLWAKLTGAPPAKADWQAAKLRSRATAAREHIERKLKLIALYEFGDFPSETTVRERFGSLNAALELAGFEPRGTGRQPRPENDAGPRAVPKPKVGADALKSYFNRTAKLREKWGDGPALKGALYELALSAIAEADRIPGLSDELM